MTTVAPIFLVRTMQNSIYVHFRCTGICARDEDDRAKSGNCVRKRADGDELDEQAGVCASGIMIPVRPPFSVWHVCGNSPVSLAVGVDGFE
jgi:hypothetical protein